jgi:hypothetical protein
MKTETKEYPVLTLEMLGELERKVDQEIATLEELELIDHYMTSIDDNDIKETLIEEGLDYLEVYLYVLKDKRHNEQIKGARVTGHLLGCIHVLQRRVRSGEKIY